VICIVPNLITDAITTANYTFTIDGENQKSFSHTPNTTDAPAYNVTVLAVGGLANTQHQVVMTVQPINLVLFDRVIYT
jgi:hypothetical protein